MSRADAAKRLARKALHGASLLLPRGRAGLLRAGVSCAVGGVIGWVLVPPGKAVPKAVSDHADVQLGGQPLSLEGTEEQTLAAARGIARRALAAPLTLKLPGAVAADPSGGAKASDLSTITRTREEFGARIDATRLAALVTQLRDPTSALRRTHAALAPNKPLLAPLPLAAAPDRALATFLTLKDEVDLPPVDAKYSLAKGTVAPDVPGRRLDVHGTLSRLDAALEKGDAELEGIVVAVPARRTAQALGKVEVTDVLGYFETKYASDNAHVDRTFNLRMASSKLDGHVILPGETFDFNEVVGPRSEAYGYRVATVIAQGELVDGIGGGTCQVSGTLHGAAFFAGLDIVERKPHTRPSGYIKMGMDATVVYPTITLKLKNPLPYPVVLHEYVDHGVVRAEILGPKRTRDVTFVRRIDGITPFREKEISDPKIPEGEKVLAQRGIPGFKVTRYRVVRDGAYAVRERIPDYYPPTAQIVRVGTGGADKSWVPVDDAHSEYVADELLTISQGPSIHSPKAAGIEKGGGTIEARVPGKYGSYGWTVREGLTTEWKREPKPGGDDNPGVD